MGTYTHTPASWLFKSQTYMSDSVIIILSQHVHYCTLIFMSEKSLEPKPPNFLSDAS